MTGNFFHRVKKQHILFLILFLCIALLLFLLLASKKTNTLKGFAQKLPGEKETIVTIANGDFEQPFIPNSPSIDKSIPGWTFSGACLENRSIKQEKEIVFDGSAAILISLPKGCNIYQDIKLTEDSNYVITGYIFQKDGQVVVSYTNDDGSTPETAYITKNNIFQRAGLFVGGGKVKTIRLSISSTEGVSHFIADTFSIKKQEKISFPIPPEIPPPDYSSMKRFLETEFVYAPPPYSEHPPLFPTPRASYSPFRLLDGSGTVTPVYFVPSDQEVYDQYRTAVVSTMNNVQAWYENQLQGIGSTFTQDALVVHHADIDYLHIRCGDHPTDACINKPDDIESYFGSVLARVHPEYGVSKILFAQGAGGFAGGAYLVSRDGTLTGGYAMVGDWVLQPASIFIPSSGTIPCDPVTSIVCTLDAARGTVGHEAGHSFNLPHPPDNIVIQFGLPHSIMIAHWEYPNVILYDRPEYSEKDRVFQSIFFNRNIPVPQFLYPAQGQQVPFNSDWRFQVSGVPNAAGYLWGFFQDGNLVWDNVRDEGHFSGAEYTIAQNSPARTRFHPGIVTIYVRTLRDGRYSDAAILTITLTNPPTPTPSPTSPPQLYSIPVKLWFSELDASYNSTHIVDVMDDEKNCFSTDGTQVSAQGTCSNVAFSSGSSHKISVSVRAKDGQTAPKQYGSFTITQPIAGNLVFRHVSINPAPPISKSVVSSRINVSITNPDATHRIEISAQPRDVTKKDSFCFDVQPQNSDTHGFSGYSDICSESVEYGQQYQIWARIFELTADGSPGKRVGLITTPFFTISNNDIDMSVTIPSNVSPTPTPTPPSTPTPTTINNPPTPGGPRVIQGNVTVNFGKKPENRLVIILYANDPGWGWSRYDAQYIPLTNTSGSTYSYEFSSLPSWATEFAVKSEVYFDDRAIVVQVPRCTGTVRRNESESGVGIINICDNMAAPGFADFDITIPDFTFLGTINGTAIGYFSGIPIQLLYVNLSIKRDNGLFRSLRTIYLANQNNPPRIGQSYPFIFDKLDGDREYRIHVSYNPYDGKGIMNFTRCDGIVGGDPWEYFCQLKPRTEQFPDKGHADFLFIIPSPTP